ncbi:hypothetical protein Ccrd_007737 [Cynara cardunculus var. scolymus]|uniref:Uncharacterized protein n=1 Tax=Cynara cardunculus var. scolymus TaxID=59895 RepID=A0A103XGD7_CYNCS|nr:hypothetical protein Ccrd_007737 [Cynara cardunculus var. scolymus]
MLKTIPYPFSFLLLFLALFLSSSNGESRFSISQSKPTSGNTGRGIYDLVDSWGRKRFLGDEEKNRNTSLVLAQQRTTRKDPLDKFKIYTGGWNIKDRHYWASVAFTAAPFLVVAATWLRNVSDDLAAAKKIAVAQVFLPVDVQADIDNIQTKLNVSATELSKRTKENKKYVESLQLGVVRMGFCDRNICVMWCVPLSPKVYSKFVCQVSASGVCTTAGRLTPDSFNQMSAGIELSYSLYLYGPFLVELQDCTFVRQTFTDISQDHCPGLCRYLNWIYIGLFMVSLAVMLSLVFWVILGRERRHRVYTKTVVSSSGRGGEKFM